MVKEATKTGYSIAEPGDSINLAFPNSETRRGRVGKGCAHTLQAGESEQAVVEPTAGTVWGSKQEHRSVRNDGICPTLTEAMGMGGGQIPMHNYDFRIRKLTPRECFRLMDFDDADFDKAKAAGVSDSQLYKQAGNSIVVAVLEAIFKEML